MLQRPLTETCSLNSVNITAQGARHLARALNSNRALFTLSYVARQPMLDATRCDARRLSNNCIGSEGAQSIAQALANNRTLTRLLCVAEATESRGECADVLF
jgi:hypothetical protein